MRRERVKMVMRSTGVNERGFLVVYFICLWMLSVPLCYLPLIASIFVN